MATTDDPGSRCRDQRRAHAESHAAVRHGPAIDAIPTAPSTDCWARGVSGMDLRQDQRGVDRPQGPGCDIGAVEASQIGEPPQP